MRVCYGASQLIGPAILLALTTLTQSSDAARASEHEIRACEFEVKARCVSGDARVTIADGMVIRLEVDVYWCGLRREHPPFTCTIDSSRTDRDSIWSQEGSTTVIANRAPFNPGQPDRVKVIVGDDVSIYFDETQSLGRCGAGAELPAAIVISAHNAACRVRLTTP